VNPLSQACKDIAVDPSVHILRYKKKEIDLALPLRLANLPNNATLELYELESSAASKRVVSVSLQTGDGKRAVLETGCAVNLLDLLKKFEDRLSQRLCTGCAGAARPNAMHACMHPCIHPSIHPSIHQCIHPSIHPGFRI
jgi:hypothetical protein